MYLNSIKKGLQTSCQEFDREIANR